MYEEQWAEYRRIWNLAFGLWLGGIPAIGGLMWLFSLLFADTRLLSVAVYFFYALGIGWMGGWIYYALRTQLFRCPRCGNWFSATWWYNLSFLARKCVHCGLGKYSTEG